MTAARDTAELERTRANTVQIGTVAEADYAKARVRVKLGELVTAWLPWLSLRAGGDRAWSAPEIGEQVAVLCPDGDPAGGIVLGAIYSTAHPAPADHADVHRVTYSDGAVIEYDRAAHRLAAVLPDGATTQLTSTGGVTVAADGGVTVTAASGGVSITGNTRITGTLSVSALTSCLGGLVVGKKSGVNGTATFQGDIEVDGAITSTGDQVADGISQTGHVHQGVQPGGGLSGGPQ